MKKSGIIYAMLALSILAQACMSAPLMEDVQTGQTDRIEGLVTDMDGTPIEHIKVTLDWNQGKYQDIEYTDSHGQFSAAIWSSDTRESTSLTITLEDIDGKENGGEFESLTDNVTFFDNEESPAIEPLVYRLNHATASESSL